MFTVQPDAYRPTRIDASARLPRRRVRSRPERRGAARPEGGVNVGEAARHAKLAPKTLRYYDEVGLVSPARAPSGYRKYTDADVHRLRFVQRARGLGFSVEDCRALLSLYADEHRASREAKRVVEHQLEAIDRKLAELESIRGVLRRLAADCDGDDRPECPILDELGSGGKGSIDAFLDEPRASEH